MQSPPPIFDVPRDQVVVFALFTHERGVLKITAIISVEAERASRSTA